MRKNVAPSLSDLEQNVSFLLHLVLWEEYDFLSIDRESSFYLYEILFFRRRKLNHQKA